MLLAVLWDSILYQSRVPRHARQKYTSPVFLTLFKAQDSVQFCLALISAIAGFNVTLLLRLGDGRCGLGAVAWSKGGV